PLFALTQYFGGVPGSSIFGSYLIAAAAALLVGSIAIGLSVSRLVGKRAVFAFYVGAVSYVAITAALDVAFRPVGGGVTYFTAINPFLAQRALLNPSGYPRGVEGAGWMLEHPVTAWCTICSLISVGLVGVSAFTARLGGLASIAGASRGGVPWYRRVFGLGAAGAENRPPRAVWTNPIAWREAAARNSTMGKIALRWLFILAGAVWGVGLVVFWQTGRLTTGEFQLGLLTTVWGELGVVALIAMNTSATAISKEREDGTLDLLLTTPMTPGMYLWGKLRGLFAYLLPLILVPLGTLLIAGLTVGVRQATGGGGGVSVPRSVLNATVNVPAVLPEAGLVASLVVLPFVAFCVMVGLQWSLKSKGMIGSIVGAGGVIAAVAGTVGLCGWHAGPEIQLLGPILSGLGPASLIYSTVEPVDGMFKMVSDQGVSPARLALAIGAACGGAAYAGIVWTIHKSMEKSFDVTVRKLAGTR
ncbi:MAG: ABC transporter permease subunit, partial [Planctomycetota bacterium]